MPAATRFLVVEDHDFQRAAVVQALLALGAGVVHQAGNGIEAGRILRSAGVEVDVVITDLMMPDQDGIELLSVIRETAPWLPVILCSSDESSLLAAQAIAGAAGLRLLGIVPKPVTAAKLSALLVQLE